MSGNQIAQSLRGAQGVPSETIKRCTTHDRRGTGMYTLVRAELADSGRVACWQVEKRGAMQTRYALKK